MPHGNGTQDDRRDDDWSDVLAHGERSVTVPTVRPGADSDRWHLWYLGIYVGTALILAGAVLFSLLPLVVGYLTIPVTMELDARYVESVTPGWRRDSGLVVLGSLLFPMLVIPYYLYQRRELLE